METSVATNNTDVTLEINENAAPVTLILVIGVFGNAIAIIVLCSSAKSHKWRPFYRFVCGLAISDGGGILLSFPFAIERYASNFQYTFPKSMCDYLAFVFMFTLMSSAMIVCCMSFDRFVATFFPLTYKSLNQGRRANVTLIILWILAAALSSLHLFGLGSSHGFYPGSWCFLDFITKRNLNTTYAMLYAVVGVVIVIITVFINLLVIVFFIKHMLSEKKFSVSKRKKDVHIIIFLLMIVIIFTSCWAPLMVNIIEHATSSVHVHVNEIQQGEEDLLLLRMGISNSVIDPWVYILFRREVVCLVLRCVKRITGRDYDFSTDNTPENEKGVTHSTDLSEGGPRENLKASEKSDSNIAI